MKMAQKGTNNSKNFYFHEIKDIKGKKKLAPEDSEIIEDIVQVHEIKEIRNINQTNQVLRYPGICQIKLEGEPASRGNSYNVNYQQYDDYQNNECYNEQYNPCNEYVEYQPQNEMISDEVDLNNGQDDVNIGYVDAPFLAEENEEEENNLDENGEENGNKIENLIESIFDKLNSDEILNNNDLKNNFESLDEDGKNEVIEGIKIKIENNEQQNRFDQFLNSLS